MLADCSARLLDTVWTTVVCPRSPRGRSWRWGREYAYTSVFDELKHAAANAIAQAINNTATGTSPGGR